MSAITLEDVDNKISDIKATEPIGTPKKDKTAVKLHIEFKMGIGNTKTISTDIMKTDADKDMLGAHKKLMDCAEYKAINTNDSKLTDYLRKRSVPSDLQSSMYLIPIALIPEVNDKLEAYRETRRVLIEAFITAYPATVEESRKRLGTQFNPLDYPHGDIVRNRFSMDYKYVSFDVPQVLKEISIDLYDREKKKAEMAIQSDTEKIQQALRLQFRELIEGMKLALTPHEDGKKRRFTKQTMDGITEFCEYFRARNIADDNELETLVGKAEKILKNVNPEYVRDSQDEREHVLMGVDTIFKSLSNMTTVAGKRAIGFTGDL